MITSKHGVHREYGEVVLISTFHGSCLMIHCPSDMRKHPRPKPRSKKWFMDAIASMMGIEVLSLLKSSFFRVESIDFIHIKSIEQGNYYI